VLTVTEMLRKKGVVGKFVEFFGEGLATLPLADRATIGNMSPEFGATCAIFPVDEESLRYLRLTGRSEEQVALVEAYFREQGLFHDAQSREAEYTDVLHLDLSTVQPSLAGPKRPQDRLLLGAARDNFNRTFAEQIAPKRDGGPSLIDRIFGRAVPPNPPAKPSPSGVALLDNPSNTIPDGVEVHHGDIVIAAITSCTNTSNPSVMLAAGLLAKKAAERGLQTKPWVKSSLAPGSRVVTDMYEKAGLMPYLQQLRFHVVGYGCMTCIGNSGPLPDEISRQVNEGNLVVCSVLSGNRNFEGRINQDVKANYLMSPPLVVAYALAGNINVDLTKDPLGKDADGNDVFLRDIWPTQSEIADAMAGAVRKELFSDNYADVFKGDERWAEIDATGSDRFGWHPDSTYVKNPPYFVGMAKEAPEAVSELTGMRAIALLGDSITTDHISPAGSIKLNSPAGSYLTSNGVKPAMFNSYGSRRGNHEVMVRGTFANIRLRNRLAPGTEGGFTTHWPTGEVTTIYDAAMQYQNERTPLLVIAGKEYGSGSSRDWAAKGTFMLGIKAVLAQSFERIHRSNLIGMGVLPLEFLPGQTADSLGLQGDEVFDLVGIRDGVASGWANGKVVKMRARKGDSTKEFDVRVRIDTPQENLYYLNGGILQYVLRQLIAE
jgi:aconitate hydratase